MPTWACTVKSLTCDHSVPETAHGLDERHNKACPSLLCYPFFTFSFSPPKQAGDDPLGAGHPSAKTRASRYTTEPSSFPVPNSFTKSSIVNTLPYCTPAARPICKSAGKKRVRADDCDENTAPSAVVTSRKQRLAGAPPRKVKRLPLREELEVLRDALPPVIRCHLDPPRDDKGYVRYPFPEPSATPAGTG